MTGDQLKARIDGLSDMAVRFVARLVGSLENAPTARAVTDTWLTANPAWLEYFGLALSAHHGTTAEPLGLKGFEAVFRNACEALDWKVDPPGAATQRFVDVALTSGDDVRRRLSLKSTAAQKLSERLAHISKLTEAAWIQDVRGARTRRDKTLELFRDYRGAVDAILLLRAFREAQDIPSRYQLLEIPTAVFDGLHALPEAEFAADGPVLDCVYSGYQPAARVALDRSDAKITVRSIEIGACTVHAEWDLSPVG